MFLQLQPPLQPNIMNRETSWGQNEILLNEILKKIERLIKVSGNTTTTTTTIP